METPPGKVIRSLRQALHMTQAEFGRAAGWSASTISSWERGSKRPSRLAFKTILAFAEERGVRYQPTPEAPAPTATNAGATLPVLRLGSRLPAPTPLVARDTGRGESFGSRRWTDMAVHGRSALDVDGLTSPSARRPALAERSDWHVDARLQVRIGRGPMRLRRMDYVAATLVALAIGLGTGALLRNGFGRAVATPHVDAARPAEVERVPEPAAAREAAPPVDELALAAVAAPAVGKPPYAVPDADDASDGASPPAVHAPVPPPVARLESIVALDGVRRASFRVGDRSIALVEGDTIGASAVARIANDEVTLVGNGAPRRIALGSDTPLE